MSQGVNEEGGLIGQEGVRIPRSGFVWHELMSTDPRQSEHFYQQVAGVSVTRWATGLAPDSLNRGQEGWPSGGLQAHWIAYFGTNDVDRAAHTAEELGGAVLLPSVDVQGMGRAAVLRDPQGAAFGVFASAS